MMLGKFALRNLARYFAGPRLPSNAVSLNKRLVLINISSYLRRMEVLKQPQDAFQQMPAAIQHIESFEANGFRRRNTNVIHIQDILIGIIVYFMKDEIEGIVQFSPDGRFQRVQIGFGNFKTVYKAYDNQTGKEVAWNVIRTTRLPKAHRSKIQNQILLLEKTNHKNILKFIDSWQNKDKKQVQFITQIIHGGTLKELLSITRHIKKIKKPKLKIIKSWCRQILQGLQYLHTRKPFPIIHRDLKCDNIFINTSTNQLKIGDLGLAASMNQQFNTSILGTPEFMAPQMFQGKYGTKVDVYAFGMCVLQMVTLQTPFSQCRNRGQIYKKVIEFNKICLREKPQSLNLVADKQIREFIEQCFQEAEKRPSASQLLESSFLESVENNNNTVELKQLRIEQEMLKHQSREKSNEKLNMKLMQIQDSDSCLTAKIIINSRNKQSQEDEKVTLQLKINKQKEKNVSIQRMMETILNLIFNCFQNKVCQQQTNTRATRIQQSQSFSKNGPFLSKFNPDAFLQSYNNYEKHYICTQLQCLKQRQKQQLKYLQELHAEKNEKMENKKSRQKSSVFWSEILRNFEISLNSQSNSICQELKESKSSTQQQNQAIIINKIQK